MKFNKKNIILHPNIDPTDWRREVKRVSKNLEIAETPEFLISNSALSSSNFSQSNNNKSISKLTNNDDIVVKLNLINNFFQKSTKNFKNFEMLKSVGDQIDNELEIIKKKEKILSSKVNLKGKINKANIIKSEGDKKQENFSELREKVIQKEYLYENILEKIESNKIKFEKNSENLNDNNNNNQKESEIKLREKIKDLKVIKIFA